MKTVKQVSELTGISIRALRYYDEIQLLVPSERSEAGYRLYDDKALEKLKAILFLKELDIPLDTIKDIVNVQNSNYGAILKDYRKHLVQKINRLQGLLGVIDDMDLENAEISFEAFDIADAECVAKTIANSTGVSKIGSDDTILEIQELVKHNMVDGKVGVELLQIYGSKANYLSAVEESALQPEINMALQEELKNIYFAFRDSSGELAQMQELVKRLEENTKKMYGTSNARYILLKVAEDYLTKSVIARVIDNVYGKGVTDTIGNAINAYYGVE